MVRAKSPEAARKLCVALGVPEEHVQTWAVRSETDEHRAELRALRDQADDARQSARDAERDREEAEDRAEELERELETLKMDLAKAEQRNEILSAAVDSALDELYRINCDAPLDAGDAERIRKVRDALGDL
jgi:chromosome segregation ATPase